LFYILNASGLCKVVQARRIQRGAVRLDGDRVEQVDLSFDDPASCTDGFYKLGKQVCPASALKVDVSHRAHYCSLGCADRGGSDHLIDQLPQVSFWKVGLELFVSSGPGILRTLKAKQKRIFLDLKFHDIPNTIAGACRSATRHVDLPPCHFW